MNNSYITIIKEKRTALSRKRIPLNQNECTADFRIGVPFEQNLQVSKEQKLEISCQDSEIVCTMTDLEEIADFYNQIKRETWVEIEGLPEGKSNICAITIYQLERHTIEKNLIEDEKLTLFEAQNQYYMSLNFHSISLRLSGKNVNRLDKGVGHIVCQVGLRFKVLCSPVKLAFFWDIEQFKLYATVRIVVGIEVN